MEREEIDLREKIGKEIEAFANAQDLSEDARWGLMRAIGVVRQKIWHNPACPCSLCGGRSNG
jgi:hypothetical protein